MARKFLALRKPSPTRQSGNNPVFQDYLLMAAANGAAVYAGGVSIGHAQMGQIMASLAALAAMLGFAMSRWLQPKKLGMFDGHFYAALAFAVIAFSRDLNRMMPEGGYPFQLIFASVFSWIMVLGSLAAWRDPTMCFQAVPAIAVFGLVGAFDTLKTSPFLFFVFLLCTATLFFRAHVRTMLTQAERAIAPFVETHRGLRTQVNEVALNSGAWRWMAGPGWALSSALLIVCLSILGAPVIQSSVQTVTQGVRVILPTLTSPGNAANSSNAITPAGYTVGRGPNEPSKTPVYKFKAEGIQYLATQKFYIYRPNGWDRRPYGRDQDVTVPPDRQAVDTRYNPYDFTPDPVEVRYELEVLTGTHDAIPALGETKSMLVAGKNYLSRPDGVLAVTGAPLARGDLAKGVGLLPKAAPTTERSVVPGRLFSENSLRNIPQLPNRVIELASLVSGSERTDYEKAIAIQREIARRCKYNLQAAEIPKDRNAVDTFLFETQEGYCDLFASAMTAMSRAAGLRSRFVIGYLADGVETDREGYRIIPESAYHAWCEIYFDRVGWVVFDATEGAESVPGSGRGDALETGEAWYKATWFKNALDSAVVVLIVGAAVLALSQFIRPASRISIVPEPRADVRKQYIRFQAAIQAKSKRRRRLSQTMAEYADREANQLPPETAAQVRVLSNQFEVALYGPTEPDAEAIKSLAAAVREFRKLPGPTKS